MFKQLQELCLSGADEGFNDVGMEIIGIHCQDLR